MSLSVTRESSSCCSFSPNLEPHTHHPPPHPTPHHGHVMGTHCFNFDLTNNNSEHYAYSLMKSLPAQALKTTEMCPSVLQVLSQCGAPLKALGEESFPLSSLRCLLDPWCSSAVAVYLTLCLCLHSPLPESLQ